MGLISDTYPEFIGKKIVNIYDYYNIMRIELEGGENIILQASTFDGDTELEIVDDRYCLDLYEQVGLEFITKEEYEIKRKERLARFNLDAEERRRQRYEELKKEFDPETE